MKTTLWSTSHLLPVAAALIVGMYVLGAVGIVPVSGNLLLLPFLALGPLGIVGAVELGRFLSRDSSCILTRAGTAFGVVAFALWEVVVAVQNGTRALWREFIVPDLQNLLSGGTEAVRLLFHGVNAVQATMDVAFDIFYCLSILLFSVAMLRDPSFGRVVGGVGILSAAGLLILNLWTFPRPPAEAGLLDLGPVTGVWWLAVIVLWMRAEQRAKARSVVSPESTQR